MGISSPLHAMIRGRETKYQLKWWLADLLRPHILHCRRQGFGRAIREWMAARMFPLPVRLIATCTRLRGSSIGD